LADQDPSLEGADNPERPEWLPDNFNAPEALVTSYKELQAKDTRTSQRLAEMERANEALEESIQNLSAHFEASQRPDPANVYNQWQEQYENDPFSTTLSLAQAVAQQTANEILKSQAQPQQPGNSPEVVAFIADQSMSKQHDDWNDYKEKALELVSQNPVFARDDLWASPQSASQALESAYKMVKADDLLSGNSVIQQQAADTRAMKLAAQSAAGSSGRTPAPDDFEQRWQEIQSAQSGKLGL
jgi:hypothetical protein